MLRETLGENSFSRMNENGTFVFQFMVSHFEAFTLGIQNFQEDIDLNDSIKMSRIRDELYSIKRDPEFKNIATGGGRNTRRYLQERIAFVERKLGAIL